MLFVSFDIYKKESKKDKKIVAKPGIERRYLAYKSEDATTKHVMYKFLLRVHIEIATLLLVVAALRTFLFFAVYEGKWCPQNYRDNKELYGV